MVTCKWCSEQCVKAGKQINGKQKYRCKGCQAYQQTKYCYKAYTTEVHDQFRRFRIIGCGSGRIAGFLGVSINTVQKWIGRAINLNSTVRFPDGGNYDIDEMQTSLGKRSRKIWITYGWHVELRKPVGLRVGGRTSEDLGIVVKEVLKKHPKQINTDRYPAYPNLVGENVTHRKGKRKANHIEREHRNMRKDIAFLIRETMCYAKKKEMLEARIRWYFWGETNPDFFLKKGKSFGVHY